MGGEIGCGDPEQCFYHMIVFSGFFHVCFTCLSLSFFVKMKYFLPCTAVVGIICFIFSSAWYAIPVYSMLCINGMSSCGIGFEVRLGI